MGLGMMGRNHARVLQEVAGVELVGVADPLAEHPVSLGSAVLVPDVEALLALGIDLAVVACPTEDHEEVALALAQAGVPALVEKPLGIDVATSVRIAEAFSGAGVVGAVGHIERFNPAVRAMRERLASGELGELFQVATRRVGPFPNRIRDVGVTKDLATHDFDLTAHVTGSLFASIAAQTSNRAGRDHEDLLAATALLDSGVVSNHLVNWLTPFKERLVVAVGERGAFVADTLTADLTLYRNAEAPMAWEGISRFRGVAEGDMVRYAIPKPEPLKSEIEGFRDAVLGKQGEIVSMAEGLHAVAVADAALVSAREGKTVQLGELP